MIPARTVHVVVPDGFDDPNRPSGGNAYDHRLCQALAAAGWTVRTRAVAGDWPRPQEPGLRSLRAALGDLAPGSLVLVDGLVASGVPDCLVPASRRLRVVVLLHLPLGAGPEPGAGGWARTERAVLAGARAVVATSGWTRRWLLAEYGLDAGRVHVARPGVDVSPAAAPSPAGTRLLCVGAVLPAKGHDVLVDALGLLPDVAWHCRCVGPLAGDPAFVARLRDRIGAAGLDGRVALVGTLAGAELAASYAAADLLVHASRAETYGMVVTEALARGLPVVAADAGGVGEALGGTTDGTRPGILVPPGDVVALAAALRCWLTDEDAREVLRGAARRRRRELTGWAETADRVVRVLEEVAA